MGWIDELKSLIPNDYNGRKCDVPKSADQAMDMLVTRLLRGRTSEGYQVFDSITEEGISFYSKELLRLLRQELKG